MWAWSAWARNELRQSHTIATKVDVLRAGRRVYTLDVIDGDVVAEANRSIMRNATMSVVDPTGEFSDGDVADDLLSPYDCEVAPYRGVFNVATGEAEYAPLGVFRLTGRGVTGDGSVRITGQDRAIRYQGKMTGVIAIPPGTPIEDAIPQLLTTRNPGLVMQTWKTGFTCGPLLFTSDIDVWAEAQKLAQSAGGWLWHDRTGRLVFSAGLTVSMRPVTRYTPGDGRLISAIPSDNSDKINNVIVATSSNTASGGVITAVVEDSDPASPTYARGSYGRWPDTIVNPYITSIEQAQQVAALELARRLGRSQIVPITAVVDAGIDPMDIATVHNPTSGLFERAVTITSARVPLGPDASMALQTQRSILTRDGRVLDDPEEGE